MDKSSSKERFTLNPKVRWKINLWKVVFIASAFVNIFSINKFTSDSIDDIYFVNLALLALLVSVVSVIVASIFIRCPRCQRRIYTPTLMWKNKMPDQKKHNCPYCNFPDENVK
jgi:hypothetical protein